MVKTKYKADRKIEKRRIRPDILFASFLGLVFVVGIGYVLYDLSQNTTVVDNSDNQPILGEVSASRVNFITVTTDDFSVKVPEDWVEVNRPQRIFEEGIRYYPNKYQGSAGDSAGRWLEVYVNEIPNIPIEKVLKVTSTEDRLRISSLSGQCMDIIEYDREETNPGVDVPGEWEGTTFNCRLSSVGNTIAAIETDIKEGYSFDVGGETKTYLLVFADHGASEDNGIFRAIVESFRPL